MAQMKKKPQFNGRPSSLSSSSSSRLLEAARTVSIFCSVVGVILTATLPAIEFTVKQQRLHRHHASVDGEAMASVLGGGGGSSNNEKAKAKTLQRRGQPSSAAAATALSTLKASTAASEPPAKQTGGIPHALVFTYKHNLLETKEPAILYDNVMDTIRQYRRLWNDVPPAPIRFLDDAACRLAIQQSEPRLVKHFDNEREGKFKADICRVADLYNHGGYYFDVDLKTIRPIRLNATITFSSVLSGYPNFDQFFQAFLATTPQHPVLGEALQIMLRYYTGSHALRGKNVGTSTLWDAYDAVDEATRGQSKLLIETKNEANGEWYYPDIPKLDGVGCCCDQICHDPEEKVVYFYARVPGSGRYCELNPNKSSNKARVPDKDKGVGAVATVPQAESAKIAGRMRGKPKVKVVTR